MRVLITSSLSSQLLSFVTTLSVHPALVTAIGAERVTIMLPTRDESTSDDLFHHDDLVVDIGLRSSIRNIMYADMEDPNTTRDGSETLPV